MAVCIREGLWTGLQKDLPKEKNQEIIFYGSIAVAFFRSSLCDFAVE
jgi:hypothetical protein